MIDRVAGILELVARNHDGLTLTELARFLDAPLSSLQGLVNGLVAAGYRDEYDRRYHLGGAPYLLNLMAGRPLVTQVGHRELEAVHAQTGLTTPLSAAVRCMSHPPDRHWVYGERPGPGESFVSTGQP